MTATVHPSVVVHHRLRAAFTGRPASRDELELDTRGLRVHLGPWEVETPLGNLAGAELVAPIGLRLAQHDGELVLGTSADPAVHIRFRTPVGRLGLRSVTATVAEPALITAAISHIGGHR
ncbi:MAG TPA: hypothetical protein VJX66_09135 [Amycolatopsis sp.]|nr:hypothetical protein [Amycolatopsis sp.]